jgi:virginiamycin B lyase
MTMRRARVRRAMAMAAGILVLPALSITGVGVPGAVADDTGSPAAPLSGHRVELSVEHTPAPGRRAAKAGSFQVYPVPTSAAGLRRITTAPNGDMWFVERDKNKVGRITPAGAIDEFNLPPQTTPGSLVKDLDVDAAGNVWVVYDSGWKVIRFHPSNPAGGYGWAYAQPYGEEVRVGPDGTWVTMSFDEDGIVKITGNSSNWDGNAPECDGALGRGRDGLMWCQQFDRLIQVNAAGSGGVSYPLPANATYPYSVATGPTGKIWFGRDSGGTMFTSPSNGNIGWVGDNNQVGTIRTGDRTAPRSLVTGPDGNVWFTSVGAAKGIGHVNAAGVGAVVQVGNYEPTSLTYGADGAIWFTDETNNAIVRVPRENLWVTNVNVGPNSQLIPHAQPPVTAKKKLKADKKRKKARLTVSCGGGLMACSGSVVVKAGKKKLGSGSYVVAVSSSGKASVKLTKAARKLLQRSRTVKVTVVLTAATGATTTKKAKLTR